VKVDAADFAGHRGRGCGLADLGVTLCNNAGVLLFNTMTELTLDDWRWCTASTWGVLHGICRAHAACSSRASRGTL
jgi:hypothetical protein